MTNIIIKTPDQLISQACCEIEGHLDVWPEECVIRGDTIYFYHSTWMQGKRDTRGQIGTTKFSKRSDGGYHFFDQSFETIHY